MTVNVPLTGNVYSLPNNRLCIMANSVVLDSLTLYCILPVSSAIYMSSNEDFLVVEEPVFKNQPMMAETWNQLAVPIEFFNNAKLKGRLSPSYIRYISSYLYFSLQSRKNENLRILTGPPLTSNSDIRWLFRQMEMNAFHDLRKPLVSIN